MFYNKYSMNNFLAKHFFINKVVLNFVQQNETKNENRLTMNDFVYKLFFFWIFKELKWVMINLISYVSFRCLRIPTLYAIVSYFTKKCKNEVQLFLDYATF